MHAVSPPLRSTRLRTARRRVVLSVALGLTAFATLDAHAVKVDLRPSVYTGGYTADVVVTNDTGAAINGWTLSFRLGSTVTKAWRASVSGSDPYTFRNLSYSAQIPAGGTQTFGFQANGTLSASNLSACTINGMACTLSINGAPVGGGGANQPPLAVANGPYSGTAGVAVRFSSAGSVDPDGSIVRRAWTFGDGQSATGASPEHIYTAAGTYTARLTVTDDKGATASSAAAVSIAPSGGGGGGGSTPVALNGQLRVCGTRLCNAQGKAIQLRGMSSHGLQWFDQCNKDSALNALASDWGADVYRLAMYVQEGGYETDPARFTTRVDQLVEAVSQRGMYVIVDWHMLHPGDPNANLAAAKTFFAQLSRKHAARNNIIYEIANEPNGVSWASIKSYAEQVIPVIRANDPDAVILVGTRGWSSLGLSEGANANEIVANPVNASNIMYTFHFYAASHVDFHRNGFADAITKLPLFVTEFGLTEYSGDGAVDFVSAQKYIDLMRTHQVSWANWSFADDFRTSSALKSGTCSGNGPWNGSALTPSGTWVRERMRVPADAF